VSSGSFGSAPCGLIAALLVASTGSCSLLFQPAGDAGADGDPNAAPPRISGFEPAAFFEGEGSSSATGGVPLLVRGGDFQQGAQLVAVDASGLVSVVPGSTRVSTDGRLLAAMVRIRADAELGEGEVVVEPLRVEQPSGIDQHAVAINGLFERALSGSVEASSLAERYSTITVADEVTVTGPPSSRVELFATGDITIDAPLRASGSPGSGVMFGVGGPGGCPGGLAGDTGACGSSGGRAGVIGSGGGGGGGGHASHGEAGGGNDSSGGTPGGTQDLAVLGPGGARGHGGGGGAPPLDIGFGGGGGGGGGGVVFLEAGGRLPLESVIDVRGGDGTGVNECPAENFGAGGGGSGGAVLLRGPQVLMNGGGVQADGGGGGSGAGLCREGGDGAVGRVRIDAGHDLSVTGVFNGPAFAVDEPATIIRSDNPRQTIRLFGDAQSSFPVFVNDEPAGEVNGNDLAEFELQPGRNQVCAVVPEAGGTDAPSERPRHQVSCRALVYLP
jgi:hypothetical protein